MADHRRELILDAFVAKLTGLATTGNNVERGRAIDWDEGISHAISISQGPDVPQDDSGWPTIFCDLGVVVTLHVANSSDLIDSDLNQMAKEINIALFTPLEPVLGLAFVEDLAEGPAEEPEFDSTGDIPSAMMRTTWIVRYERNRFDPST